MKRTSRRYFLKAFGGGALAAMASPLAQAKSSSKKLNVVMIVCDDLNDFITGMDGHPQARTPNVSKLAKSGVAFKRAYSNNPVCAPSRASFLTGIYPHKSKNLFFDKWFENPVLKNSKTLMHYFRDNGYYVAGSGKLMHHGRPQEWSEFKHKADYGPFVYDGKERVGHPSVPEPFRSIGAVDGSYAPLSNNPYPNDKSNNKGWIYGTWGKADKMRYVSEDDRDPTPDERNAKWASDKIKELSKKQDKPFFLGVGFIRPHTPLHVPKKYFDMFPLQDVKMPVIKKNDAEDCHYADVYSQDQKGLKYFRLLKESYPTMEDGIKAFTQAYLASIAAVDECIGEVVKAVDTSPLKDNTVILLTSDHGWNMGEKDYLFKNSLWEESTRVPLVIRAPGTAKPGGIAEHPVSLIDIYPTLADLCGLKGDTKKNEQGKEIDGHSLRPFLVNPKAETWNGPDTALTMIFAEDRDKKDPSKHHWSVRTKKWRYIRYNDDSEELYDHDKDPYEWTNLAEKPESKKITLQLHAKLVKQTGLKL